MRPVRQRQRSHREHAALLRVGDRELGGAREPAPAEVTRPPGTRRTRARACRHHVSRSACRPRRESRPQRGAASPSRPRTECERVPSATRQRACNACRPTPPPPRRQRSTSIPGSTRPPRSRMPASSCACAARIASRARERQRASGLAQCRRSRPSSSRDSFRRPRPGERGQLVAVGGQAAHSNSCGSRRASRATQAREPHASPCRPREPAEASCAASPRNAASLRRSTPSQSRRRRCAEIGALEQVAVSGESEARPRQLEHVHVRPAGRSSWSGLRAGSRSHRARAAPPTSSAARGASSASGKSSSTSARRDTGALAARDMRVAPSISVREA